MGEVGIFDFAAFREFRKAPRRNLSILDRLTRENEPLLKTLTAQLMGRQMREHHAKIVKNRLRVPFAEDLDWEVAMNAARVAFMKAMRPRGFNPKIGKLSGYLKNKIRHELQEAVRAESLVRRERDTGPVEAAYYDDEDHLAWLTRDSLDESLELESDDEDVLTVEAIEDAIDIRVSRELPPAPPPAPPPDRRPALVVLLEDHLRFARLARAPASAVHGRYESIARARGEYVARGSLAEALLERGVPRATMRVPWSTTPVEAFAGIALQARSRPSLRPAPGADLQVPSGVPERSLRSGHGG